MHLFSAVWSPTNKISYSWSFVVFIFKFYIHTKKYPSPMVMYFNKNHSPLKELKSLSSTLLLNHRPVPVTAAFSIHVPLPHSVALLKTLLFLKYETIAH